MEQILEMLAGNWQELVTQFAITIFGFVVSWFVVVRKYLSHRRQLREGESDDVIFQAHYLVPIEGTDRVQLIFRNLVPNTTVEDLYENPAAQRMIRQLAKDTTLSNPILQTNGQAGFEVLNDAFSHVAGHFAISPFKRERWLFTMTCEDKQAVRKTSVRCFLIREADLERFLDWNWCRTKIAVEGNSHWFRIVALHQIALAWKQESQLAAKEIEKSKVDRKEAHRRIRNMSVGLSPDEEPVCPPIEIPWKVHDPFLREQGIELGQKEAESKSQEE